MLKYSAIILFAFVLPLPTPLLLKTLALLGMVLNLLVVDRSKFMLKKLFTNPMVVLFALFFLIDTFTGLANESSFIIREIKLTFLLVPMLFFWKNQTLKKVKTHVELSFVAGVFVYIIFAWCYAIYFYTIKHPHYEFSFFNDYTRYIFYHYLPGTIDHNYLGMYLFLAAIILYRNSKVVTKKWSLILIALLVINMPFLGGKTMIAITLIFVLILIFREISKKRFFSKTSKFVIASLTVLIICGSVVVVANWFPKSLTSSIEKREAIYNCGIDGGKELVWSGIGYRKIAEVSQYCTDYDLEFKPHSIFLDELLSNGIFGLLILLAMLIFLFRNALRSGDIVYISLISVSIIVGALESILSRQWGVFFFVFFTSLYYAVHTNFDSKGKNASLYK